MSGADANASPSAESLERQERLELVVYDIDAAREEPRTRLPGREWED